MPGHRTGNPRLVRALETLAPLNSVTRVALSEFSADLHSPPSPEDQSPLFGETVVNLMRHLRCVLEWLGAHSAPLHEARQIMKQEDGSL